MVFAKLFENDFGYQLLLLLHLIAVVVGFGSSFVWPALAARARKLEPAQAYAMNSTALGLGKGLTTYPIYAAGLTGIVLVAVSEPWGFDQTWISIAFLLFILGVCVSLFLHTPNLKAMNALQERLVSGGGTPTQGGPPAEVAELQERGKRAGMYGGLLHLIFLLLMIDMIWKPGL
jgi:uncharacterized membrane protein